MRSTAGETAIIGDTAGSLPPEDPHAGSSPTVSVLLATHGRARLLERALESVATQTLAADRREVVVVVNGPAAGAPEVVEAVRTRHPDLRARVLQTARPGVAHARQVGLWVVRGDHVTILDDDDWLSPGYLEALVEQVAPGVVPLAWLAEAPADPEGVVRDPAEVELDHDNYFSTALRRRPPGSRHAPHAMPPVVSLNVGKLVPTALAREVRYDETLRGGSDFVWWTRYFTTHPCEVRVPDDDRAVYVRTRSESSLSRQEPGYDYSVSQRLACIGSLESLRPARARDEKLVQRMVDAQCGHVRRHLEAHPEDRERVAEDVLARRLTRVDWRVVNRGPAPGLALLYAFTPWNSTSGLVAARRVRDHGVVSDVVCHDLGAIRESDTDAALIADPWVAGHHAVAGTPSFDDVDGIERWSRDVFAHLADRGTEGTYSELYSRAMWIASQLVAAQYKVRHPDVRWTAELSDPLSRTIRGKVRQRRGAQLRPGSDLTRELTAGLRAAGHEPPDTDNAYVWAEHVTYALADEVVFTNVNQREYMLGYCGDAALVERARAVGSVSAHPTLPRSFYDLVGSTYAVEDDRVNLAYFGVFYPTRGLSEIAGALSALPGPVRSRVRLHVFTNTADETREEVRAAGLGDVVVVNPYRPFLEFLNLTTVFDLLVVNDAAAAEGHGGTNPYLPSKVSDYLGSGTPIWALVEPGSVMAGLETLHHRTELGDVDAAVAVLTEVVRARSG